MYATLLKIVLVEIIATYAEMLTGNLYLDMLEETIDSLIHRGLET